MTLAAEAIMNQAIIVRETTPGVTLRAGSRAIRKRTAAAVKIPIAPAATPREREYKVTGPPRTSATIRRACKGRWIAPPIPIPIEGRA